MTKGHKDAHEILTYVYVDLVCAQHQCLNQLRAGMEEHTTSMNTPTEAVWVNSLTGCETTADGVPKCQGRSMSVQWVVAHLSLQRWEFAGEVPHHVLVMVVVSEVHVVLVYFTLHVQVSVRLNDDFDHV